MSTDGKTKTNAHEPPAKGILRSYAEEPRLVGYAIGRELSGRGLSAAWLDNGLLDIDNQNLLEIVTEFRARAAATHAAGVPGMFRPMLVQTMQEHYLKPFDDSGEPVSGKALKVQKWMERSPLRMKRLNECVEVINTSNDMDAFKMAMNDMCAILEARKLVFAIAATASPARPAGAASSPSDTAAQL